MAAHFTFISCAATAGVRRGDFPGNEPIDDKSREMLAAGRWLAESGDRVWRSPLLCAAQTAQALGLKGTEDVLLKDCDYGRWAGRSLADIQKDEPADLETWIRDPASSPHSGESIVDLIRRVGLWIEAHRRDAGHSLIVTHANVIRAAIMHVIEAPPACFGKIDIAPLSRTVFSAHDGAWRLASAGCKPRD